MDFLVRVGKGPQLPSVTSLLSAQGGLEQVFATVYIGGYHSPFVQVSWSATKSAKLALTLPDAPAGPVRAGALIAPTTGATLATLTVALTASA